MTELIAQPMPEGRRQAIAREPALYDDLRLSLAEAWRLLDDGVSNAANAFHQPVIATTALDGSADARVAVLRRVEPAARELRFHTDLRTGKLLELARDPRAMVVSYDAKSKVQLRLSGVIAVHHGDALADAAWAETRKYSRQGYRIAQQPGAVLASPYDADFQPQAGLECGTEHFAVLRFTAHRLEWLYLAAAGHRRARFDWQGHDWQGQWLAP